MCAICVIYVYVGECGMWVECGVGDVEWNVECGGDEGFQEGLGGVNGNVNVE